MPTRICLLALLLVASSAPSAVAQQDRYEMGRRLRLTEAAWLEQTDADARRCTLEPLKKAVSAFFSLRFGDAARALDDARTALQPKPPADEVIWFDSLAARADGLLVDAAKTELSVKFSSFYTVKADRPDGLKATIRLVRGDKTLAETTDLAVGGLPTTVTLHNITPSEGDCRLEVDFLAGKRVIGTRFPAVARVKDLDARLAKLREAVDALPKEDDSVESATLRSLVSLLRELSIGRLQETEHPAARLFEEAEALAAGLAKKNHYYDGKRAGQFWLTIPLAKVSAKIRLLVPEEAAKGEPIPLVIALHGAGGSENMFFDAYGSGLAVSEAKKRGWLMVAPRSELWTGTPPTEELIDTLAERYPVDRKRVYLMGHSMGAAQSVATASRVPDRFAAVAPIAGGGTVTPSDALKTVPFFAVCGTEDFLLNGARGLKRSLEKSGVQVRYEEPAETEHMMIVPAVLPEVFRFFEKAKR